MKTADAIKTKLDEITRDLETMEQTGHDADATPDPGPQRLMFERERLRNMEFIRGSITALTWVLSD